MNQNRQEIGDFSGALQSKTVSHLALRNQVLHCMNAVFDKIIGAIVGRLGSEKKSQVVANQKVMSLHIFRSGDVTAPLASSNDGTSVYVYKNSNLFTGSWSKVTTGGVGIRIS